MVLDIKSCVHCEKRQMLPNLRKYSIIRYENPINYKAGGPKKRCPQKLSGGFFCELCHMDREYSRCGLYV